ncbi:hypothetical protein GHT06_018433 [Daphnia sinensis]|uniref:Uncharacterized protein n=1 Tax=Daphnia sinensis TaxID=1820382 RepID=A0AAD5L555_9CRUS|nr:hypothetical protein GHT06_018433 [Daphnia sinensis]
MADENVVYPPALFGMRTNAKRRHTNLLRQARELININATREEFEAFMPTLELAHTNLVHIHERYVAATRLDDGEQHAAATYLENINNLQAACDQAVAAALQRTTPRRAWNISNTVVHELCQNVSIPQPEHQEIDAVSIVPEPQQPNGPLQPNQAGRSNDTQHDTLNHANFDLHTAAKQRKIDLEFRLKQAKIKQDRELKDLELRNAREREDLELEIQYENHLIESCGGAIGSPPNIPILPVVVNSTPPAQPNFAPSHHWLKLDVAKFNGNPRKWLKYAHGIRATIRDVNMPESLKLLGLQESLKEDIQRRVAHIFTGAYTFQSAWAELEKKYGSPHLIIQAHDQHMQQLPSFRTGVFNALFNLAAAVRDAVSSVDESHVMMFNTIANLLHTKLPINLQTDWGKYAYGLDRMATLKDFDKWIDRVLSAEELRGGKLSSSNTMNAVRNPVQPSNSNRQLGSYTPGSSNYNYPRTDRPRRILIKRYHPF